MDLIVRMVQLFMRFATMGFWSLFGFLPKLLGVENLEWWQIHTLHRLLILKYRITILSWFPRTVSLYETLPQPPFRRHIHIVLTNRGLRGFGFSVFPEGVSTCVADSLAVGVAFHSVDFAVEDLLLTRKLKF